MHTENDLLPISALQHMLFCERQTALIHIERQWEDNRLTAEGNVLHKKADAAKSETRDGIRITRGLPVHSLELGLYGVCDVVQFKPPDFEQPERISLPKRLQRELKRARQSGTERNEVRAERVGSLFPGASEPGERTKSPSCEDNAEKQRPKKTSAPLTTGFALWTITPVEYKRGKPKSNDCDRVQLCAQAMCLEEMLGVEIRHGDLFYGKKQRRTEVALDEQLRATARNTTRRLHELIESRETPRAVREKKCDTCSLLNVCMPPPSRRQSASQYLKKAIEDNDV